MSWACDNALTTNILDSYQVAGPVFAQALQSFFAAQCALVGDHLWPKDATLEVLNDPNYDFIVVGAGSAGAAVANRLSEYSNWKVLLVEAGGNPQLMNEVPQLFYNSLGSSVDWGYQTQPQDGACRSYKNKGCAMPRGKVLGGSSATNGMFYVRGNKADYDQWAADGNYGWSHAEVLPYFLKHEKYHNINDVEPDRTAHPLEKMVIEAAVELGLKNLSNINGANQMGITVAQTSVKNNHRFSTATAYLSTAKTRQNLHVLKHAYATKLLFAPGTNRVSGVQIRKNGKDIIVNAEKEVILSAGAINSPQLLMLSGLGPKKHLEDMGIEVRVDLPVGENLQDHVFAPVYYRKPDNDTTTLSNIVTAFGNFIKDGTGPLIDTSPHRVISFINTTDPTSSVPDVQFHYLILAPGTFNLIDVYGGHGLGDEALQKFNKMNENNFVIQVYVVLLTPRSSGRILLASNNPFDKPLLYSDYFQHPEDMATLLRGMKQHALKLGSTKAFQDEGFVQDWLDIDACKKFEKNSDDHLECIARELTFNLYHPIGTVKMGPDYDSMAVVDPELRVRHVEGLRVIDSSIMPNIVRGNTNAASIMIGEKGAHMIKEYWFNKQDFEF